MEHKSKNTKRLMVVFISIVILFVLYLFQIKPYMATIRLLKAVDLDQYPGLYRVDYAEWTDPLKYTDGYEISVLKAANNHFSVPSYWKYADTPELIETIAQQLDLPINHTAYLNLSLGGSDCYAWRIIDRRSNSIPFDEREFYLVWCSSNYGEDLIFIYRGHHLYGI